MATEPTEAPAPSVPNVVDPELLSILRCPLTRSALHQEGDSSSSPKPAA